MKKIRTEYGWFFKFVMRIVKIFKKKLTIYNLNDEAFETGIIISNHSAASGPMTLALYFPTFFVPWGTHEMKENYCKRWKYLYHIFYQQKLGYNKFKSFLIATLFAIISRMLYNGMQLIQTYGDLRLVRTIKNSIAHLEKGNKILIFPEDSETGYHEKNLKYNEGFIFLSQSYYKKYQLDLPIYPVYYHKRLKALIIGKKEYVNELLEKGMTREEVAEHFKDVTNNLADQLFDLEGKQLTKEP